MPPKVLGQHVNWTTEDVHNTFSSVHASSERHVATQEMTNRLRSKGAFRISRHRYGQMTKQKIIARNILAIANFTKLNYSTCTFFSVV